MIIVLSFLVLIVLFFAFGLIFSKVKINIEKLDFKILKNEFYEKDYIIKIGLYLYGKIKILGITFNDDNIKFMGKRFNFQSIKNTKFYRGILKPNFKELDKKVLIKKIKNLKLKFEKFHLDLSLGTDNTLITSFLIFVISTIVSIIIQKGVTKYKPKKHSFIITPRYENCNLMNIDLDFILSLKTYNLIKMVVYIFKISKDKEKIKDNTLINKKKHYPGYV